MKKRHELVMSQTLGTYKKIKIKKYTKNDKFVDFQELIYLSNIRICLSYYVGLEHGRFCYSALYRSYLNLLRHEHSTKLTSPIRVQAVNPL